MNQLSNVWSHRLYQTHPTFNSLFCSICKFDVWVKVCRNILCDSRWGSWPWGFERPSEGWSLGQSTVSEQFRSMTARWPLMWYAQVFNLLLNMILIRIIEKDWNADVSVEFEKKEHCHIYSHSFAMFWLIMRESPRSFDLLWICLFVCSDMLYLNRKGRVQLRAFLYTETKYITNK